VLKVRLGTNEILTSLMLVYIAELTLDYLVRGPWRDPRALNFPQSVTFDIGIPIIVEGSRIHVGAVLALVIAIAGFFLLRGTLKGFEVRVLGQAPRAAAFAGFSPARTTLLVFALSGGLAGLAGALEVVGTMNQLRPTISPGYGFAAIIVAFLGRLNPIGVIFAGLLLALSYLGGENAQIMMKIPLNATRVLQGLLLFFVLACDLLILYRVRIVPRSRRDAG
jgi:simple sugar transport system permease protein